MASITTISSKYQELVSRSTLISGGHPNIYQFKPRKEELGTLTRMTVGEKNPNRPNKAILLVGEVGSGKSTLINALFNHMMGVMWEDEIWFDIVDETSSKTSDVIVYQIFGSEGNAPPYSLTIIDTPGFGYPGWAEHDRMARQRLLDVFRAEDGVRSVHAMGLVVKSSDNRVSDELLHAFNLMMSLFEKDMEKNTVALVTHSDGLTPQNTLKALEAANIKCAINKKNQPVHFMFSNLQKMERTKEDEFILEHAWKITKRGMDLFTNYIDGIAPQELNETIKATNILIRLVACIENLQDRIQYIDLKREEIKQKQEAVRKYEEAMKTNEEYVYIVIEQSKEKEKITDCFGFGLFCMKATCCDQCKETCHYPCNIAVNSSWCEVMQGDHCTACSKKCPASSHVRDTWKYVSKTTKVKYTNEQMKDVYYMNKWARTEGKTLLEALRDEEKKMLEDRQQLLDEAFQYVLKLEQLGLNINSVSTYIRYDFLMNEMSKRGDQEKLQKLQAMMCHVDEGSMSEATCEGNTMGMKGDTK